MANYQLGDKITVDLFKAGDIVDVIGTSKGHGYTGTIKRWNMTIGPKGHGSGYHRGTGSMGSIDAARIKKGKKLAGRLGGEKVTIQNLVIANKPNKVRAIAITPF